MSKLRNWWPSDEALERSRSSNSATTGAAAVAANDHTSSNAVITDTARALMSSKSPYNLQTQILDPLHASATLPSSSPTAAPAPTATIRLSEVAAALNAMPTHLSSSSKSTPSEQNSSSPSPHLSLSRPVIKLTNTEDHKVELLKKLLCRSESSSDLKIDLQHNAQQTQAVHLQKNHATATVERRMQYSKTEGKACTNLLANEDSADLRKRKRDHTALTLRSSTPCTNQDMQEQQTSSPTPKLSGIILKESLSRREIHIFSERERRKGMAHLYAILHSLLPDAKPKTDRCTVLTEAMEYIHELQMRLDDLGRQKNEIAGPIREQLNVDSSAGIGSLVLHGGMDGAESGMNDLISEEMRKEILAAADVVVRFCGQDAFITLNSSKGKGVWSTILNVLHQQNLELLNVTLSTSNDMDYHCIHAKMSNSELQSHELQKMLQDVVLKHAILDDQD